jgi:hypothetical protein
MYNYMLTLPLLIHEEDTKMLPVFADLNTLPKGQRAELDAVLTQSSPSHAGGKKRLLDCMLDPIKFYDVHRLTVVCMPDGGIFTFSKKPNEKNSTVKLEDSELRDARFSKTHHKCNLERKKRERGEAVEESTEGPESWRWAK